MGGICTAYKVTHRNYMIIDVFIPFWMGLLSTLVYFKMKVMTYFLKLLIYIAPWPIQYWRVLHCRGWLLHKGFKPRLHIKPIYWFGIMSSKSDCIIQDNEEHYNIYDLPNIIRFINSRRMIGEECVPSMGEMRNA